MAEGDSGKDRGRWIEEEQKLAVQVRIEQANKTGIS